MALHRGKRGASVASPVGEGLSPVCELVLAPVRQMVAQSVRENPANHKTATKTLAPLVSSLSITFVLPL